MSSRLFSHCCPVARCAPKRRSARWPRRVAFVLGSLLLGWLLSGCEGQATGGFWQGAVAGIGGLFLVSLAALILGARRSDEAEGKDEGLKQEKMRLRREFWESCQWPHDVPAWTVGPLESLSEPMPEQAGSLSHDDVFEPLRAPGEAILAEDVQRILVACAAEGRCIMKHLRRAQTTLSVEDYGDELRLAERKLDAVVRCVEALAARCAGMTKPETRNQNGAEVLGDIECCEREGGVL